jgi:hypothetical protein
MTGIAYELVRQWAAPSGILITTGLIIWLIQLNANAISNAEDIGALRAADSVVVKELKTLGLTLQRTTILQESLYQQVDQLDESFDTLEQRYYESKATDHTHPGSSQ